MFTSETNSKVDRISDLAILLVLFTSSRAAFEPISDIFLILVLVVTFVCWFFRGMRVLRLICVYLIVSTVWISTHAFVDQYINWTTVLGHYIRIVIALFVIGMTDDPMNRLVNWTIRLTAAGLVIHAIGQLSPSVFETFYRITPSIMQFGSGSTAENAVSWERANWLFFTFSTDRPHQFHGFMWEPAAAGMIMTISLWLRLLGESKIMSLGNCILILGILATLSTTSIIALTLTFILLAIHLGGIGLLAIYFTLPILTIIFFKSDILWGKILHEFQAGYSNSMTWSLSRFASFTLDMRDFKLAPLMGNGIMTETARPRLASNNGFSDYLSRYGLMMTLYISFLFCWGAFQRFHDKKIFILGICLTILIFSWSEKFFELPFFYLLIFANYAQKTVNQDTVKPVNIYQLS